ncbi:MAG: PD40 domain-containing protein, partial [Anaerolineales bacterium]|nr:PD40 domain-containing protein [Anaerolineales bacterium]
MNTIRHIYLICLFINIVLLGSFGCAPAPNDLLNENSVQLTNSVSETLTPDPTQGLLSEINVASETLTPDTTENEFFQETPNSAAPTPIEPSVTPNATSTFTPSPENSMTTQSLFLRLSQLGYGKISISINPDSAESQSNNPSFQMINEFFNSPDEESENIIGPGNAIVIVFSNFSNQLAYINRTSNGESQIWISDIDFDNPQLIYVGENHQEGLEGEFQLTWSPDDKYLFITSYDNSSPNRIYHLETGLLDIWPWKCDFVALSTRTEHIALWCRSLNDELTFAVMEWGGKIWYSTSPPDIEVATLSDPTQNGTWAWSSDGQLFAYFDTSIDNASLNIINQQGDLRFSFPDVAWWKTNAVEESKVSLPEQLLRWSQSGENLLVFSFSLSGNDCPLYVDPFAPLPSPEYEIPCWQVFNVQTGLVEWDWSEFSENTDTQGVEFWQNWHGDISSNGQLLAFQVKPPLSDSLLVVINRTNGNIVESQNLGTRM